MSCHHVSQIMPLTPGNPLDQDVPSSFCLEEPLTGDRRRPPTGHTNAGKIIYSDPLFVHLNRIFVHDPTKQPEETK